MKYSLSFTCSLLLGAMVVACGDDDSDSGDPDSGAVTEETDEEETEGTGDTEETEVEPTEETDIEETEETEITDEDASSSDFMISSPDFDDGDALPEEYTCEGKPFGDSISPELNWSGAPEDTLSYALVFVDTSLLPDAPQFGYHYAAWNIPVSLDGIPEALSEGQFPDELEGGEQFRAGPPREPSFFGPCPSWQTHCFGEERVNDSYSFILYAFDEEEITPPDPEEGNYVHQLDLFFQELAITSTEVTATSDASPSSAPMCPDDVDAGADAGPTTDGGTMSSRDAGVPAEAGAADASD